MDIGLLWLFLFLALAIGWFLGYSTKPKPKAEVKPKPAEGYKHRLQLLFDSYSDDSIDQFVQSLDVTPETLGIHISIGKHFRTQGEVEKAILIHQNLMAHPSLSDVASEPVIYELAKDYKAAGLYDRAEALLLQLRSSKEFSFKSKKLLLDIFESEKDWDNAVQVGTEIDLKRHPDIALRVAYYYCELAEDQLALNEGGEARRHLKKAISIHKECVRAYLALAQLDMQRGEYRIAISILKQVVEFSPQSIAIVLPVLRECTLATNSFERYQSYLMKLFDDTAQIPVKLALVESYDAEGKEVHSKDKLADFLLQAPSLGIANALLSKVSAENDNVSIELVKSIQLVLQDIISEQDAFQCEQCGFSGQQHYWMCPSCKGWQTTLPVIEYEAKGRGNNVKDG